VGVQQTAGAFNNKDIVAETSVALNPGLLQTDLSLIGDGTLNGWIWGSKTVVEVTGTQTLLVKSHPTWLSETYGNGAFSFHQAISATPSPVTVDGIGNWLESGSNPSVLVNPNGTLNQPAQTDFSKGLGGKAVNVTDYAPKISANGLPAYRVTDHPRLKSYLDNLTIPYEICPTNGEQYKTVTDPKLGTIQVYNL
jgi:hypothetical protein